MVIPIIFGNEDPVNYRSPAYNVGDTVGGVLGCFGGVGGGG